jgi:hypothetical protein
LPALPLVAAPINTYASAIALDELAISAAAGAQFFLPTMLAHCEFEKYRKFSILERLKLEFKNALHLNGERKYWS